jgi:transcriptional regulator with XRE-family HTH domain
MNLQQAVAARLTGLLAEKKLTQYALCHKVGMNQTTIYNITHARCETITLDTLFELSEGLDMTMQEFLNDKLFDKENLYVK